MFIYEKYYGMLFECFQFIAFRVYTYIIGKKEFQWQEFVQFE